MDQRQLADELRQGHCWQYVDENLAYIGGKPELAPPAPTRVTPFRYSSSESGGDGFRLSLVARAGAKASPEKRNQRGFHFS
jgi:hypothetical protein